MIYVNVSLQSLNAYKIKQPFKKVTVRHSNLKLIGGVKSLCLNNIEPSLKITPIHCHTFVEPAEMN